MNGLTPVQAKALAFIRSFIEQHGWSSSIAEIADGLGLKSKSATHRIVVALSDRGAITFAPNRSRSIRLVDQPRSPDGVSFLDQHLAVWVRVLAARAGVTPLEVVNEAVRDAYTARKNLEQTVSSETTGRSGTQGGAAHPDRPAVTHAGG